MCKLGVGWDVRDQNARETIFCRPADIVDGIINIVNDDLWKPATLAGKFITEIFEPSGVGSKSSDPPLIVFCRGLWGVELGCGKERRDGIGENDFCDNPISVLFAAAPSGIPVPVTRATFWCAFLKIAKRIPVGFPPFFKLVMPAGLEIRKVVEDSPTTVGICGDDGHMLSHGKSFFFRFPLQGTWDWQQRLCEVHPVFEEFSSLLLHARLWVTTEAKVVCCADII